MNYPEEKVAKAFQIYTTLARVGVAPREASQLYRADEEIRSLLDLFSHEVDAVVIQTSEQLYLVPLTKLSPFHVSNDWVKRHYLRNGATNGDIYLLYFASIILLGAFYDTYQSQEPTRQFIRLEDWSNLVNERISYLQTHDQEELIDLEKEFSYNWRLIIEKWEDMNDIKETAKKQSGNTISRLSFMDTVKRFLIDQDIIEEIGNDEVVLTEKAKTVVQRFFMEVDFNKGIFEFIYGFEGEGSHAIDQ